MPEYKKKKVKKAKKNIKNTYTDDIKMVPKNTRANKEKETTQKENKGVDNKPTPKKVRIIRGNKLRNKRRRQVILSLVVLAIAAVVITSVSLPTGIFEFLQNAVASTGSEGGYPSAITGGSLINSVQMNNVFITVTPTHVSGYNQKTGKSVFNYQHGYERPLVAISDARFMIFTQGGKEYSVYNFEKKLFGAETENDILTAAIARDGTFAIATQSDGYSSEVAVYNKKGKKIFEWFCANYIINDILLSDNGNKLVLSAINAQKGTYVSKLVVLEVDNNSATPIFSKTFENKVLLNVDSDNLRTFYAVFENKIEFFRWNSFENIAFDTEKDLIYSRTTSRHTLLIAGHNSNKGSNTAYIFNNKGEKISEFDINCEITDVAFKGEYIYILSDKTIYLYSVDGESVAEGECTFGVVRIMPISHHNAVALTDNSADKIYLE